MNQIQKNICLIFLAGLFLNSCDLNTEEIKPPPHTKKMRVTFICRDKNNLLIKEKDIMLDVADYSKKDLKVQIDKSLKQGDDTYKKLWEDYMCNKILCTGFKLDNQVKTNTKGEFSVELYTRFLNVNIEYVLEVNKTGDKAKATIYAGDKFSLKFEY